MAARTIREQRAVVPRAPGSPDSPNAPRAPLGGHRYGDGATSAPEAEVPESASSKGNGLAERAKAQLDQVKTSLERYTAFRVLESVAVGYRRDKISENAAAMTYFGVFSIFPLIMLFMALAGLALQSSETAREQILGVIYSLLPQGQEQLRKVIASVVEAKGVAAGIGIVTLLWGALGWFQIIDNNINAIWGVTKPRTFIKGKLFALAMVASIGGVALASFAASAMVGFLERFTSIIPGSDLLWQLVISLLSVLTIAGAFFVLYRYTPRRHIHFADIWPGAITTALIWEVTRRTLAFYLERTDMVSGYGPIGAAMALLFWIYVVSNIILLGAEISYAFAKERRHIPLDEEMAVIAPPGEQPTPKFAPQIGEGVHKDPPSAASVPSSAPEPQRS